MSMPRIVHLLFPMLIFGIAGIANAGWDPDERARLLVEADQAIANFKRNDPSLETFFRRANGYVVFPTVGKGGFWVGGAYGEGVVYRHGEVIGYSALKQLTVGLQFGGQAYSEIIFFKDDDAIARFKSGKLELGIQASAVVATKGSAANHDFHDGVAVFTLTKGGLMAEASVGGQTFSFQPR